MRIYSNPERANETYAMPDVEVFWQTAQEAREDDEANEAGWYYWYCFPGCMPDSDANGPYSTAEAAIAAAQADND